MSELLNEKQVAEIIGMSVFWLRRKRWEGGGIKYIKLGTASRGAVRYRKCDVEVYITERVRKSTSDAIVAADDQKATPQVA
jgi:predicted DNA-binding transcriptional regulator AlpA